MRCLECKWVKLEESGLKGLLILSCSICKMEDCEDFKPSFE
jgi:hypothetical protein